MNFGFASSMSSHYKQSKSAPLLCTSLHVTHQLLVQISWVLQALLLIPSLLIFAAEGVKYANSPIQALQADAHGRVLFLPCLARAVLFFFFLITSLIKASRLPQQKALSEKQLCRAMSSTLCHREYFTVQCCEQDQSYTLVYNEGSHKYKKLIYSSRNDTSSTGKKCKQCSEEMYATRLQKTLSVSVPLRIILHCQEWAKNGPQKVKDVNAICRMHIENRDKKVFIQHFCIAFFVCVAFLFSFFPAVRAFQPAQIGPTTNFFKEPKLPCFVSKIAFLISYEKQYQHTSIYSRFPLRLSQRTMKIIVLSEVPPKEKRQCHEWCIQVSVTLKQ